MCKKANIHLIYGENGSGKTRLISELKKKRGSYLFTFNDIFSKTYYNNNEYVQDMYEEITGKKFSIVPLSHSQNLILNFCYELYSILDMESPFNRLFIDGLPCELDSKTFNNLLTVLEKLCINGYKLCFATCKEGEAKMFRDFFEDKMIFKETLLPLHA